MKNIMILVLMVLVLVGCSSTNPVSKRADINQQKINVVSKIAWQTDKAITQTNLPLAKDYNLKVLSVVGMPEVVDMNKTNFDKEIVSIQTKEDKIDKQIEQRAIEADKLQTELSDYQSYWGLGGVVKGLWSFLTHSVWALLILFVIFIVLRVAAASNPLCNVAFGLFQSLGATLIHIIETLIPASLTTLEMTKADVKKVGTVIAETINSK